MAKKWEVISAVPESDFLRVNEQTFDFFTQEEAERLIHGADGLWRHMIIVALKTGLRIGELRRPCYKENYSAPHNVEIDDWDT